MKIITVIKGRHHKHHRHYRPVIKIAVRECPVCNSQRFSTAKRLGFHPLARYYCHNHHGFFFAPKDGIRYKRI